MSKFKKVLNLKIVLLTAISISTGNIAFADCVPNGALRAGIGQGDTFDRIVKVVERKRDPSLSAYLHDISKRLPQILADLENPESSTEVVFVEAHEDFDPDSIGSSLGVVEMIRAIARENKRDIAAIPLFNGGLNPRTEIMLECLGVHKGLVMTFGYRERIQPLLKPMLMRSETARNKVRLIPVDQNRSMFNELRELQIEKDGGMGAELLSLGLNKRYDHHKPLGDTSVGASATLVAKAFFDKNIPMPPLVAEALLIAIYDDTLSVLKDEDKIIIKLLRLAAGTDTYNLVTKFSRKAYNTAKWPVEKMFNDAKVYIPGVLSIEFRTSDLGSIRSRKQEILRHAKELLGNTYLAVTFMVTEVRLAGKDKSKSEIWMVGHESAGFHSIVELISKNRRHAQETGILENDTHIKYMIFDGVKEIYRKQICEPARDRFLENNAVMLIGFGVPTREFALKLIDVAADTVFHAARENRNGILLYPDKGDREKYFTKLEISPYHVGLAFQIWLHIDRWSKEFGECTGLTIVDIGEVRAEFNKAKDAEHIETEVISFGIAGMNI